MIGGFDVGAIAVSGVTECDVEVLLDPLEINGNIFENGFGFRDFAVDPILLAL
ncbi:MAG TPA: hypothetical protein VM841_07010 [Actinomycetota bacterium]|nr:hypothetical protein [Actinomycetota bacterium]